MEHDHAPVVSCVPYSPGGWFVPLATTQLSGAPATHGSRQPEICTVAPGERLGRVVAANVSDSGVVAVGAVCDSGAVGAAAVGAVSAVVAGDAVVFGAEVVGVVVVGASVVDVVVVGEAAVVVVGGISSAESLATAKVVGGLIVVDVSDSSSAVVVVVVDGDAPPAVVVVVVDAGDVSSVVVVVVDAGGVSVPSAEATSTWSDELDESPRLVIAHTPRPPIISPLTRKIIFILSQF